MAAFIAAQRADHGVPHATGCRALSVSQAWFYKRRHRDPSPQHARREQLKVETARLFAQHRGRYGSPRITADLHDEGWQVSKNTGPGLDARARAGRPPKASLQVHHPARRRLWKTWVHGASREALHDSGEPQHERGHHGPGLSLPRRQRSVEWLSGVTPTSSTNNGSATYSHATD